MVPYNNVGYRNDWPDEIGEDGALVKRIMGTRGDTKIRPDWRTWSCNGALVDNWEYNPRDWGQDDIGQWRALLQRACARLPRGKSVEFILNKRDNPLLFVGLREPFPLPWSSVPTGPPSAARGQWHEQAVIGPMDVYHFAPILSQYTTDDTLDVPVPPLADWHTGTPICPAWSDRAPSAIFRGTATAPVGGASSQRTLVVRALRDTEHDAVITGHSGRYRFDTTGKIGHTTREATEQACGARIGRAVSMDGQARVHQCAVYAEGNAGANRLGGLLARGFLVAVIRSSAPKVVWLRDGTLVAGRDYLDVDHPESLERALGVMRRKPCVARSIASRGYASWEGSMRASDIEDRYCSAMMMATAPAGLSRDDTMFFKKTPC